MLLHMDLGLQFSGIVKLLFLVSSLLFNFYFIDTVILSDHQDTQKKFETQLQLRNRINNQDLISNSP